MSGVTTDPRRADPVEQLAADVDGAAARLRAAAEAVTDDPGRRARKLDAAQAVSEHARRLRSEVAAGVIHDATDARGARAVIHAADMGGFLVSDPGGVGRGWPSEFVTVAEPGQLPYHALMSAGEQAERAAAFQADLIERADAADRAAEADRAAADSDEDVL